MIQKSFSMASYDWIALVLFFSVLLLCVRPLGTYIACIYRGDRTWLSPALGWLERGVYRAARIDPGQEMSWTRYAKELLWFNGIGWLFLLLLQLLQQHLPLNPEKFSAVAWPLACNTAMSFATNTNWQAYAGEVTMSNLTQMLGLAVQNFLSSASGLCALFALMRGLSSKGLGNFWADLVRSVLYLLVPLSIVLATILMSQGCVQTFSPDLRIETLEGTAQVLPMGPVASQVAIKQLGTNGGGFFGVNSAHPLENPSAISNFFELLAILLIPAALPYTFGIALGAKRQGWVLFFAAAVIFLGGLALGLFSEFLVNPIFHSPSWEGKETRFGILQSTLWTVSSTCTSNGSANAMFDSLSPLTGGVALFNIMLGEVVFGGVGVGLCGLLMFVFLAMFLAGLMIGRSPAYLGKKIEKREVQWTIVAILVPSALILLGASLACAEPFGLSSRLNAGPHGLSEILYAFASPAGNNGSAFAGLNANTLFYNLTLSFVMGLARLSILIPSLAIAGQFATKRNVTDLFRTDCFSFFAFLVCVILVVGGLTFFPALCLGPIVEHFLMLRGETF